MGGHWVPQMIEMAGGVDVLGLAGEKSRTAEWAEVEAAAPAVVVSMPCGYDTERAARETLEHAERLAALGARVAAVDASAYFSRPGPRLVDGVELLAHLLHPGLVPEPPAERFAWLDLDRSGSPAGRPCRAPSCCCTLRGPVWRRRAAAGHRPRAGPRPLARRVRAARARPAGRRWSRRAPRWWCTRWRCCGARWPARAGRCPWPGRGPATGACWARWPATAASPWCTTTPRWCWAGPRWPAGPAPRTWCTCARSGPAAAAASARCGR